MAPAQAVAAMSLDEQIGQTIAVGFYGTSASPEVVDLIQRHHVGGVILFSRNIRDAAQLRTLTAELQVVARSAGHRAPLLIAIDQENGAVRRLGAGTTVFPGNMAIGATGSTADAYAVALATGRELAALGVNFNLAPVADVNNNPDNPVIGVRSFGEDPQQVAGFVAAAVRGYHDAGVLSCLKHFPGHGDTTVDSHLGLPVMPFGINRLKQVELLPFAAGIDAGAPSVMIAHIAFPRLGEEADRPATISARIVRGLLRERLGFDGAIVSDWMGMSAIADTVGTEEGTVRALAAGVDLVFVSNEADEQRAALARVRAAVESSSLPQDVVSRAATRVLRLKAGWPSAEGPITATVPTWVGGEDHRRLAEQVYERSVTLVRNDAALLPLRSAETDRLLVLYPERESLTLAEDNRFPAGFVAESVRSRHPHVDALGLSHSPTHLERGEALQRAARADVVLFATMNAGFRPEQAELMRSLLHAGRTVVGVAVRNPYDLLAFPELQTYLATYEYTPPALEAAVRVLFGDVPPQGRLPVSLPGLHVRGAGVVGR